MDLPRTIKIIPKFPISIDISHSPGINNNITRQLFFSPCRILRDLARAILSLDPLNKHSEGCLTHGGSPNGTNPPTASVELFEETKESKGICGLSTRMFQKASEALHKISDVEIMKTGE